MKTTSLFKVLSIASILGLSSTGAQAAPAFGFINLTIYGYFVNPIPAGAPATSIPCVGEVSLTVLNSNQQISIFSGYGLVSKSTNSTTISGGGQSFTCQVTIPYYFNNVPTGSSLVVGFSIGNYATIVNGTSYDSASVSDFTQSVTPVPTNYVTTNISAIALL